MINDICLWFKTASSPERIELLCSLIQLCFPQEVRFVGSCVEDRGRKDEFAQLVEQEKRSNNVTDYDSLNCVDNDILEIEFLRRLITSLSFLKSSNSKCADRIYSCIIKIYEKLFASLRSGMISLYDNHFRDDLLLLLTLAAFHPAFIFKQRMEISNILLEFKRIFSEYKPYSFPNEDFNKSEDRQHHLVQYVKGSFNAIGNDAADIVCSGSEAELDHVTEIGLQTEDKGKGQEVNLKVTWFSRKTTSCTKSMEELRQFIKKLQSVLGKMWPGSIPVQTAGSGLLPENIPIRQQIDLMHEFFRSICNLPREILCNEEINSLFCSLFDHTAPSRVSCSETTRVSSVSQSLLGVPMSCPAVSNLHHISNHDCVSPSPHVITSSSSSPVIVTPVSHSLPEVANQPRNRETEIFEKKVDSPPYESHPPRTLGVYSPPNVSLWLKEARLQKYDGILSKFSWDELGNLTDDHLEKKGMTKGARKKFFSQLQEAKKHIGEMRTREVVKNPINLKSSIEKHLKISTKSSIAPSNYLRSNFQSPSHPSSLDSSCSEDYLTPLGSPDIQAPVKKRDYLNAREVCSLGEDRSADQNMFRSQKSQYYKKEEPLRQKQQPVTSSDLYVPQKSSHSSANDGFFHNKSNERSDSRMYEGSAQGLNASSVQPTKSTSGFKQASCSANHPSSMNQTYFSDKSSNALDRVPVKFSSDSSDFTGGRAYWTQNEDHHQKVQTNNCLPNEISLPFTPLSSVTLSLTSSTASFDEELELSDLKMVSRASEDSGCFSSSRYSDNAGFVVQNSMTSIVSSTCTPITSPYVSGHSFFTESSQQQRRAQNISTSTETWDGGPAESAACPQCSQCFSVYPLQTPFSTIPSPWNPAAVYYSTHQPFAFNNVLPGEGEGQQYFHPNQYQHNQVSYQSVQASTLSNPRGSFMYPVHPSQVGFHGDLPHSDTAQVKFENQVYPHGQQQQFVLLTMPRPMAVGSSDPCVVEDAVADLQKTMCSNCGKCGHISVACSEPCIDAELKMKSYQLNMSVKDTIPL